MTTQTTTRERQIETYRQIRESACEDIRTATHHKVGTQWMADRIRDIEWANRQLVRLGAIPAMA
jgi:hypothetical protein